MVERLSLSASAASSRSDRHLLVVAFFILDRLLELLRNRFGSLELLLLVAILLSSEGTSVAITCKKEDDSFRFILVLLLAMVGLDGGLLLLLDEQLP